MLIAATFFTFVAAEAETVYATIVSWNCAEGIGYGNWTAKEHTRYSNIPCAVTFGGDYFIIKFAIRGNESRATFWGYDAVETVTDKRQKWYVIDGEDSEGKTVRLTVHFFPGDRQTMVISTDYYTYRFIYNIQLP